MTPNELYVKQLEDENEKLRVALEKQDTTIGEVVRKYLKTGRTPNGTPCLSMKMGRCDWAITFDEFEILKKMDVAFVEPRCHQMSADDVMKEILRVQPMGSSYYNNSMHKTQGSIKPQMGEWDYAMRNYREFGRLYDEQGIPIPAVPKFTKHDVDETKDSSNVQP